MSDTIFALSSGPGRAGVAVVRVTGPRAAAALEALAGVVPPARRARLAALRDPRGGAAIDNGLTLFFPAPHSVTGQDVAELQVHGGRAVVGAVLNALGAVPGLRPAEPGEFTRRAFEHGKLDLSQVEGLADLIAAETEAQRRQALRQMDGALSQRTEAWRARLVGALAHLEAAIDFADEDLPEDLARRVRPQVLGLIDEVTQYIGDDRRGERLRDGIYVAVVGAPNVGKSTLVNALARRDVAIVSEVAGTTRDVIEIYLDLGGYPVSLADTAGLRDPGEPAGGSGQGAIEAEGMRRARAGAAAADLRLAIFDLRAAPGFDRATLDLVDADTLVVLNKADLAAGSGPGQVAGRPALTVSAKTGQGVSELLARLEEAVAGRLEQGRGAAPLTRVRHRRALEDCLSALRRAAEAGPVELAAEDLRLAARALGRIAGRVDVEDVLDAIFREFCIGK